MDDSRRSGDSPEFLTGVTLGLRRLTDRIATEAEVFDPSLESIVAVETTISAFDDVPSLRGYPLADLTRHASFPEVAFLLLGDDLPDVERLADFQSVLVEAAELPGAVADLVAALPLNVTPMEVLRTTVSALAHFDPQPDDRDRAAASSQAVRLIARLPLALALRRAAWSSGPLEIEPDPDAGFAANLLTLLTGEESTAEAEAALEAALIVTAEQGLDASALAARAAVSTGGDLFAALTAAMAVWSGPLHGGPRPEVLGWLLRATQDADGFVRREIAQGHSFAGFDGRATAEGDARAAWLTPFCRRLAAATGNQSLERAAETAERLVAAENGTGPALDWPLTRLLHYLGFDPEMFKAVAALARIAGWSAHAVEQSEHNQLLRPRGRYVGPPNRRFVSLEERG